MPSLAELLGFAPPSAPWNSDLPPTWGSTIPSAGLWWLQTPGLQSIPPFAAPFSASADAAPTANVPPMSRVADGLEAYWANAAQQARRPPAAFWAVLCRIRARIRRRQLLRARCPNAYPSERAPSISRPRPWPRLGSSGHPHHRWCHCGMARNPRPGRQVRADSAGLTGTPVHCPCRKSRSTRGKLRFSGPRGQDPRRVARRSVARR